MDSHTKIRVFRLGLYIFVWIQTPEKEQYEIRRGESLEHPSTARYAGNNEVAGLPKIDQTPVLPVGQTGQASSPAKIDFNKLVRIKDLLIVSSLCLHPINEQETLYI